MILGKPYAIIATDWSSSLFPDSDEDKQVEFVHDYFSFVDNCEAEFAGWFSLHDQGDWPEAVRMHFKATPQLQVDEDYIRTFKEFMCSPGLKNSDGSPKKAWHIWRQHD